MAKTVEELMELGLSQAEAERVVNRAAKAEAKSSSTIATAEKRLPTAQAKLDHASARRDHWQSVVEAEGAKVAKYTAIIAGEEVPVPAADTAEADVATPEDAPAASKAKRTR